MITKGAKSDTWWEDINAATCHRREASPYFD